MGWVEASLILFGGLVAVMGLGLPVAFAFLALNIVGAWLFLGGEPGLAQLSRNAVQSVTSFSLTPIPFFVLMRSEEHTSELQSPDHLVCRLLLAKKKYQ